MENDKIDDNIVLLLIIFKIKKCQLHNLKNYKFCTRKINYADVRNVQLHATFPTNQLFLANLFMTTWPSNSNWSMQSLLFMFSTKKNESAT